jgi:hypothetical protein
MGYRCLHEGKLFGLRWVGRPENEDLAPILQKLRAAREKAGPLVLLVIIPEDSEPPGGETRKKMRDMLDDFFGNAETSVGVLEGKSVRASLNRTVARMLMMFSRFRAKLVMVSTLDEALPLVAPKLNMPATEVRRQLREGGVI